MHPDRLIRLARIATIVGAAGALLTIVGWILDPRQAAFSWLAALAFWLSIALGALLLVMIHHAINASWFIVLRRYAEVAAETVVVLALLWIPIAAAIRAIYPWTGAPGPDIQAKRVYLNVPFFLVRGVLYFAIWIAAARLLSRWSEAMQNADDARRVMLAQRLRVFSAALLPAVAFALTFASFDWLMSLSPDWYSTVFGVYWFAGGFLAALAVLGVMGALTNAGSASAISTSHVHALGKLMLTFVIFWAYIGYAQLLLIWIADIPAEAAWYVSRLNTRWSAVGAILLIGHFTLPLLALLSRELKRRRRLLAITSIWLLVMHYIDIYWLVLPALHPAGPAPHWLDVTTFAAVGGFSVAFAAWRLRHRPLIPEGDPRLERSIRFVTR